MSGKYQLHLSEDSPDTYILLAKNALILAFIHFPTTLIMGGTFVLPMYMTYADLKLQPLYVCCWFFFGFGLIAYVHSLFLYRVFKTFLPPENDV